MEFFTKGYGCADKNDPYKNKRGQLSHPIYCVMKDITEKNPQGDCANKDNQKTENQKSEKSVQVVNQVHKVTLWRKVVSNLRPSARSIITWRS